MVLNKYGVVFYDKNHIENLAGKVEKKNDGTIIANITFDNLSYGIITAIKLRAKGYNSFDELILINNKEDFIIIIQDLYIEKNTTVPSLIVPLPNSDIRRIELTEYQICFDDRNITKYTSSNIKMVTLEQYDINDSNDKKCLKAIQYTINDNIKYKPIETDFGWICGCGRFNKIEWNRCSFCQQDKNSIFKLLDTEEVNRITNEYYENHKLQAENKLKRKKKIRNVLFISILAVIIISFISSLLLTSIIPEIKYNNANTLFNDGKYQEAITAFEELDGYKNSEDKILESKYNILVNSKQNKNHHSISIGGSFVVGLLSNGQAVVAGNSISTYNHDLKNWNNILSVSAGSSDSFGLKSDGTVISTGSNYEEYDVSNWSNIVSISAGEYHTIGLKSDGTVVSTGSNSKNQCNIQYWNNIISISAGGMHSVGLRSDGTVIATGWNECGQCDVDGWKDITAVSAGGGHTVGLKTDGTVVAVGTNNCGQCNVSDWKDIIAVSAGYRHTVGLKSDGTVVVVGKNDKGQCNVSSWEYIIEIDTSQNNTVGVKADGSVVMVGDNTYYKSSDFYDWRLATE